ncbi:MAG TPA: phosphotransferase, partial [Aggregatilineaceae bacterium]|nr:phosphotransferase [Aggregatilineaceae bacterium]
RQFAALLARMHAIDARPFLPPSDAGHALIHGDMWPGNVLWKDGKIAAVIDWEDAACGDPLEDVAISRFEMLLFFGVEAMDNFTQTYQTLTQIDLTPLREWDRRAAERVEPDEWAAPLAQLGRADITAEVIRAAHQFFMVQARGD